MTKVFKVYTTTMGFLRDYSCSLYTAHPCGAREFEAPGMGQAPPKELYLLPYRETPVVLGSLAACPQVHQCLYNIQGTPEPQILCVCETG